MLNQIDNGLKTVPIPTNIDGDSEQMKKINCYNRNVNNLTCTAIKGTGKLNEKCKIYCPYFIKNMQAKLTAKFVCEIRHETEDAYLINHDGNNYGESWLPKSIIKSKKAYGDDSWLITVPNWFTRKNGISER